MSTIVVEEVFDETMMPKKLAKKAIELEVKPSIKLPDIPSRVAYNFKQFSGKPESVDSSQKNDHGGSVVSSDDDGFPKPGVRATNHNTKDASSDDDGFPKRQGVDNNRPMIKEFWL